MGKAIFLNIGFVVVVIKAVTTGFAAEVCPSPPVVYASEGSNVTICWKIVPEANLTLLRLFKVMALLRPGEKEMKIVGRAYSNGTHDRKFNRHANVYIGRATVEADLVSKILYLRLVNYTSQMENIYCAHYEMGSGSNPITTCHSQAVFLRNTGNEYVPPSTVTSVATEADTTIKANTTNLTSTVASTTVKRTPTAAPRTAETNYKVAIIIMGCLLGAVTFLALFIFVLYCRIRKKPQTPQGASTEMKEQKRLLEEKA